MIIKQLTLRTILIAFLFLFCGCYSEKNEGTSKNKNNFSTNQSLLIPQKVAIDKTSLIDFENQNRAINPIVGSNTDKKTTVATIYSPHISKVSQGQLEFSIDKLKLTEVDRMGLKNKDQFSAILSLCYTLKNNSDEKMTIHPKKAVLILANGQLIEENDFINYWEDVFPKGKKKNGSFHFSVAHAKQIKQMKTLKLTFSGHPNENKNTGFNREYTFEFPLVLSQ